MVLGHKDPQIRLPQRQNYLPKSRIPEHIHPICCLTSNELSCFSFFFVVGTRYKVLHTLFSTNSSPYSSSFIFFEKKKVFFRLMMLVKQWLKLVARKMLKMLLQHSRIKKARLQVVLVEIG